MERKLIGVMIISVLITLIYFLGGCSSDLANNGSSNTNNNTVPTAAPTTPGTTGTPSPVPTPDTVAPAEVTGLSAAFGTAKTTLSWTEPADVDYDHVIITWIPADGITQPVTVNKGTTKALITGLTNETAYTFTVKTVDTIGNSSTGTGVSSTPTSLNSLAIAGTWWGDSVSPQTPGPYPRIFTNTSQSLTANTPKNAFNGNTSGTEFYVSGFKPVPGTPAIIGMEFQTFVTISTVSVYGRFNTDRCYNPSDYTVETSMDGTSWTVQATLVKDIDTKPIGAAGYCTYQQTPIVTTFATPVVTKFIRLNISATYYKQACTDNSGANSTQIAEIKID